MGSDSLSHSPSVGQVSPERLWIAESDLTQPYPHNFDRKNQRGTDLVITGARMPRQELADKLALNAADRHDVCAVVVWGSSITKDARPDAPVIELGPGALSVNW